MRNNQLFINNEPASYGQLDIDIIHQLDLFQQTRHTFFVEQLGETKYPVMLRPSAPDDYNNFGPIEIPAERYLMLGDIRDSSLDSRVIGLVSRDRITGRAHTIAFSVDYDSYYMPRMDRFIRPLEYK